jgi:large subunit ribosomal protein L6
MSRVAKKPVELPQGVSATVAGSAVTIKGSKGSLTLALKPGIKVASQAGGLPSAREARQWMPSRARRARTSPTWCWA